MPAKSTTVWVTRDDTEWGERFIEIYLAEPCWDADAYSWDSSESRFMESGNPFTVAECEQLFGFVPEKGACCQVKLTVEREG